MARGGEGTFRVSVAKYENKVRLKKMANDIYSKNTIFTITPIYI